ncbi:MAG: HNH endonuclease [Anaerolineae bacterium]|nr:HNH endonuclease [Anaerolineae bacterium]
MAFPPDVATETLLDCGRHCCICHKFCGLKIELHHIIQEADGGDNTYDNCIPLCFDCHAEVQSYNPRHPKGRKYTVEELKGHRDRWYKKVENSYGLVTNPEYREPDRFLFSKIRNLLPSEGETIMSLRNQDFATPFLGSITTPLYEFDERYKTPEYAFFDVDIDAAKTNLGEKIRVFLDLIGQHTFVSPTRSDLAYVPNPDSWEGQRDIWYLAGNDEQKFQELIVAGYPCT